MAKETGLGWTTLDVDDEAGGAQDIREDVTSLSFATPRAVQDVTNLAVSAMERLGLLADFSAEVSHVFDDDTADSVHDVFADLSNVRTFLLVVSAQTLTNEVLFTDYSYNRAQDGSFTGTAPCVLANGVVPNWT